jgi:hypothetical protein
VAGHSDRGRRRLCSRRAKAKAAPRTVGFVPEIVDSLRWFDSQPRRPGCFRRGNAKLRKTTSRRSQILRRPHSVLIRQPASHSVGVRLIGEYPTLNVCGSWQRCRSNLFAKYCSAPMGSHSNIRDGVKNLRWQFAHEAIAGTLPLCFKIAKRRSVEPHE